MNAQERLATAFGPLGNLFQLVAQPELRCRNLSPLAFYALQRAIQEADDSNREDDAYSESQLTRETQLGDYKTSRACSFLRQRGLVTLAPASWDRRVRLLMPTEQGRATAREVMAATGKRLWTGIPPTARKRRVRVLTEQLRDADKTLHGIWQPTFFDKDV